MRREEKEPRNSEEAEYGVLGSVLIDQGCIGFLISELGMCEEAFYIPRHQIIWATMVKLMSSGRPIDAITLTDQLKMDRKLEAVGGPLAISGMIEATPTETHVEHYAKIVMDCWSLRKALDAGHKITAMALDESSEDGRDAAAKGVELLCTVLDHKKRSTSNNQHIENAISAWTDLKWYRDRNEVPPLLGMPSGFDRIDDLIDGIQPSLIVIGARQSTGKTTLEGQIVGNLLEQDIPILRLTRDSAVADLWKRDICRMAGVSLAKMNKGYLFAEKLQQIRDAQALMKTWPVRIIDDIWKIKDVCATIRADVAKRDTKLITLDFLQMYRTGDHRIDNDRNARMEEVVTALKMLVLELRIPIIALSQFARDKDRLTGKGGVNWIETKPIMEDLKDSGSIEQLAEVIMLLGKVADLEEENGEKGKRTIIAGEIAKNKNGPLGPVFIQFDRPYFKMTELDRWQQGAIHKFLQDEVTKRNYKNYTPKAPAFESVDDALRRHLEWKEIHQERKAS